MHVLHLTPDALTLTLTSTALTVNPDRDPDAIPTLTTGHPICRRAAHARRTGALCRAMEHAEW